MRDFSVLKDFSTLHNDEAFTLYPHCLGHMADTGAELPEV